MSGSSPASSASIAVSSPPMSASETGGVAEAFSGGVASEAPSWNRWAWTRARTASTGAGSPAARAKPDDRVGLVDRAVGVDPEVGLADPRARRRAPSCRRRRSSCRSSWRPSQGARAGSRAGPGPHSVLRRRQPGASGSGPPTPRTAWAPGPPAGIDSAPRSGPGASRAQDVRVRRLPHGVHRPPRLRDGRAPALALRGQLRRDVVRGGPPRGLVLAGAVPLRADVGPPLRPHRAQARARGDARRQRAVLRAVRALRQPSHAVRLALDVGLLRGQHLDGPGVRRRRDHARDAREGHGHDRDGVRPRLRAGPRDGRAARQVRRHVGAGGRGLVPLARSPASSR